MVDGDVYFEPIFWYNNAMIQSNTLILAKSLIWDIAGNVIYFPVWWYTRGLARVAAFLFKFVSGMEMRLAVRVWVANIFRPMYAVTDIPGRIISLIMRLAMIVVRGLGLCAVTIAALCVFIAYMLWPVILILMILLQI